MRRAYLVTLAAAVFIVALAVPLAPYAHAAPLPPGARPYGGGGTTPPQCTQWHVAPSPLPAGTNAFLSGVAADAANDVWAVGSASTGTIEGTLVEHYNGTAWSIVSSPNVSGSTEDDLYGVIALASNNVWAVGDTYGSNATQPLIEHYDGSSWTIASSPALASGSIGYFSAVAADAANDVWAVGYLNNASGDEPLTAHYNGSSWSLVTAPAPTGVDWFNGVSVVSGQAFAVGYSNHYTLAEHYASGSWSVMTTPNTIPHTLMTPNGGAGGFELNSVVALSPTNVWAVGNLVDASNLYISGIIEHYDGSAWSLVANGSTLPTGIDSVAAVPGTTNLWATGYYGTGTYTSNTFAEQWQGNGWNSATTAVPATSTSALNAVAVVSSRNAWAVGYTQDLTSGTEQTLIEHYAGPPAGLFCP